MGSVLGKDHIKKDIALKVTGKAEYVADIRLPGMLECSVLKSPYAHAKILSVDARKAEKLPGVRAVITQKDKGILLPRPFNTGSRNEFHVLPPGEVYMAGEQIAAVAAETKEVAEEAIKLIEVEFTPLPSVFDPLDALKPDAPVIYSDLPDNNVPTMFPSSAVKGDVDQGFREADITLQSLYQWPNPAHCPLETYQTIAKWDGDELTVWISTQTLWEVQDHISWALGIPASKISVITKWVGSGYGAKYGPSHAMLACIVAALSKKTGRPVRSLLDMDEQFIVSHHAAGPGYYNTRGGIKRSDGRPVALDTAAHISLGGHACHEVAAATIIASAAVNVYNYDNIRAVAHPVYSNINMAGPKRSYGDAEGMFCSEQFADEMAEVAGMDPIEWRKKWCNRAGDPCSTYFQWGELAGGNYVTLMTKAAEVFDWKSKWKGWKTAVAVNGAKKRGIGMALSMHTTGFGSSTTLVRINNDGTVHVNCSAEDIGQGIKSATAMSVAEILGVRYEDVTVSEDNTKYNPRGGGVYGSKGTPTDIGASINAAENARAILLKRAALLMQTKPEGLDVRNGKIIAEDEPTKSMTIGDIAGDRQFGGAGIYAEGQVTSFHRNPITKRNMYEKSLAALCCEVEVDTETGKVEVLKMVIACDCGVVINPEVVKGQCDGGIIQGLGFALYEDMIFDKANEGIILNPTMTDYKVPTFPEFRDFTSIVHSDPADAPTPPLHAKGMGESTIVPVAPAIANAVYNAIGVRVKSGPITPDKVLEALGKI
jgi:xanthine dehydrogenase molybdenum-binding subunit